MSGDDAVDRVDEPSLNGDRTVRVDVPDAQTAPGSRVAAMIFAAGLLLCVLAGMVLVVVSVVAAFKR